MKKNWLALSIFTLAVLIRFFPFLLGSTLYFGDNYSLMVPGKIFTADWIRQGVLPLWNPYIFSGINWIGDINQSVLYPSTLLFVVFSGAVALNLTILLHTIGTGIGMYFLSKKFCKAEWQAVLAGLLWMFSTQVTGSSNNLSTIQSIAWIPWILFVGLLVGKHLGMKVLFALAVLGQFLAGYPQHVIYTIFIAVILQWWMRPKLTPHRVVFQSWLATGLITVCITAVAWLPFAESFLASTRISQSSTQAQVGSLNPAMLPKMLLTYLFDKPTAGMKWGPAWSGQPNVVLYIGWVGLLAVSMSALRIHKSRQPIVRFSFWLVVITMLISFGSYIPGYELLQQAIPLLRVGRYPSLWLMFTNIFAILWVVTVLPYLTLSKAWLRALVVSAGVIAVGSAAFLYGVYAYPEGIWLTLNQLTRQALERSTFHTLERDMVILQVVLENIIVVATLSVGVLIALYNKWWRMLVVILTAEVLYSTQGMLIFGKNEIYAYQSEATLIQQDLPQLYDPQYRTLTRSSNSPYSDFGSYWEALVVRAPFSDSFVDVSELRTHERLRGLRDSLAPDWNMVYQVPLVHGYTALLPESYADLWRQTSETRINFIDQVPLDHALLREWSVRYYLVDRWYPLYEETLPAQKVATRGMVEVYELPDTLPRFRYTSGEALPLTNFRETPNYQLLEFPKLEEKTTIRIADRYDQNWKAVANGVYSTITNSAGMRELNLPAGTERLELFFVPQLFIAGLMISVISCALLGVWWFFSVVSRRL